MFWRNYTTGCFIQAIERLLTSRKFQLFRIEQIGLLTDRTDRRRQEMGTPFLANQKAIRLDSNAGSFPEQRLLIKPKAIMKRRSVRHVR